MNIVLIGFMASGKTTVGKTIAKRLNMLHIDTDQMIVSQQNMEVKDIFSSFGEAYFRLLEKQAIEQLNGVEDCVISVGGGAVMHHNNLERLKKIGSTVFLDAPLSKILLNLKSGFRPLVGNSFDQEKIGQLLQQRYPTYRQADIIIKTDDLGIEQIVDEICRRLKL